MVDRLQQYAAAGADCVYAPGLTSTDEIELLVGEVEAPVNVLIMKNGPDAATLASLGVRRASSGSAIFNSVQAMMEGVIQDFLGERNQ